MDSRVFLLASFWTWLFFTTAYGHRFSQISSCTCLGYQIEYNCTTFGRGSTVWDGTAFDCPLNEILLRHSQFPTEVDLRGICNAGDICAHADNTGENDTFISRLVANVTSDLVNKTIACSYDDGSRQHLVNSSIVSLTKAPFPPPMDVKLSSAGKSHLHFSWSDVVRPSCPALYYKINTTNCGACPTTTNKTEIQCTGFEVSIERQLCKLSVQTVVCDGLISLESNEITVTLQLPSSPNPITIVPQYNRNGQLQKLHTSVTTQPGMLVFGNISSSPTTHTFHYFNEATNMSCGSSTTSCSSGNCTDIFDFQLSRCSKNADVSLNIDATNLFGKSPVSSTVTIRATNDLVNISIHNNVISCQFYGFYMIGSVSCNIVNITNEDCEEPLLWTIVSEEITHNSTTIELNLPPNLSAFCLTLTASNGSDTVIIQDTFIIYKGGNSMAAVIVSVIVVVLTLAVLSSVAVAILFLVSKNVRSKKKFFTRVSFKPSDKELEVTYCELKRMNPIDSEDQVETTEPIGVPNDPPPSYYAISNVNPIED